MSTLLKSGDWKDFKSLSISRCVTDIDLNPKESCIYVPIRNPEIFNEKRRSVDTGE